MQNPNNLIPKQSIWKYDFTLQMPSEKIAILVRVLRKISDDEEIKNKKLLIPDKCEKYGFVEGKFDLSQMLHFLADMIEE